MSSKTKEKVKQCLWSLVGATAHVALVVALLASALGLDLSNLSLV
jgi:hypothetical protein